MTGRRRAPWALWTAAGLTLLVACDVTAPRGPQALEPRAAPLQSAAAGTPVQSAPAVRVLASDGDPLEGVDVRFAVTAGGGSLGAASGVTGPDGTASAGRWTLGTRVGNGTVTASVEGLPPLVFQAVTLPGPATTVEAHVDIADPALGETVRVDTRVLDEYGNLVPVRASLAIHEDRWLDEYPVLEPASSEEGRFRVSGPGRAELRTTFGGLTAEPVTVSVLPEGPVVVDLSAPDLVGPSDQLVLRGYRLDEVDPSTVTVEVDP